jgi:hypothetical protein
MSETLWVRGMAGCRKATKSSTVYIVTGGRQQCIACIGGDEAHDDEDGGVKMEG